MILYILQARTSSTRLPGKVLLPILGVPMFLRQIERLKRSCYLNNVKNKLLVATSTHPSDNPIETCCNENKIACFRGSLDDVLDRFYQATQQYKPKHIVRVTADCPLIDPEIIDQTITFYLNNTFDYVSNTVQLTFPHGLDVEIFTHNALKNAWGQGLSPYEREHVTPYIKKPSSGFKIGNFANKTNKSDFRWTVDQPEDFEFVTKIYELLYPQNHNFLCQDIFALLEKHPELHSINAMHKRKIAKNVSQ